MTLDELVEEYIARYRGDRQRELRFFKVLRTDEDAVGHAALARLPGGAKHPHRYRIPPALLEKSRRRLLAKLPALRQAESFDELITLIDELIRPIDRIGELVVYDTALRIGARLGLEPERVYVHRGTRDGLRRLGLDARRATFEMSELPEPIRKLSAREAEDFLCVYKGSFAHS